MNFIYKNSMLLVLAGILCVFAGITCAVTPPPPGVVVDYYDYATTSMYVAGPSIAILPNGDYIACHGQYPGLLSTHILRSQNKGVDWTWLTQLNGQYESTLFVHDGVLYLIGGFNDGAGNEYVAIRKSTDGGSTWTTASDAASGLITPPGTAITGGYNGGPGPVLVHNGRIWRASEKVDPTVPSGLSQEFRAMVVSVPVDANLLDASNWTVSNTLLMKDYISDVGWLEGNAVAAPDGSVKNILRVGGMSEKAAVIQVSSDGATLTFSPQTIIDFPGGAVKFVIKYDPQSDLYWSLVNKQTDPAANRNRLVLTSSPDLVNWTVKATILEDADSTEAGFQYVDWQIDGQDIIFVSRTAFGGSGFFHDAEFMTFHRIPNFRIVDQATTSVFGSSEDAEVDQHPNWAGDTKGIPLSGTGWTHLANELRPKLYGDDYDPNDMRQDVLIKWDITSIPSTDIITAVTLDMSGWDYPDGIIDVYGIEVGDWAEATVTWNNWTATTKSMVLLGQMTSAGPAVTAGNAIFSNSDLLEWVQAWEDGSQANYGIILKMTGEHPATGELGDGFSAKEEADNANYGHSPQLIIQHIPESAFATLEGTVDPDGYTGDLQNVGVQVELRQNDVIVRTDQMLLDAVGDFSVSLVPLGTYDVAVKALAYLQKVVADVNISTDPTDLGTIVLEAGDLNGDSVVNLLDFSIMANSWLSAEEP